jgi:hypothetical protein
MYTIVNSFYYFLEEHGEQGGDEDNHWYSKESMASRTTHCRKECNGTAVWGHALIAHCFLRPCMPIEFN